MQNTFTPPPINTAVAQNADKIVELRGQLSASNDQEERQGLASAIGTLQAIQGILSGSTGSTLRAIA